MAGQHRLNPRIIILAISASAFLLSGGCVERLAACDCYDREYPAALS